MGGWFTVATIFFVSAITGQNDYTFSDLNQNNLADCIENYLTYHGLSAIPSDDSQLLKIVAFYVAKNFHDKTKSKEDITSSVQAAFKELRDDIPEAQAHWTSLESHAVSALLDHCRDQCLRAVSKFEDEPDDVSEILNTLLEGWLDKGSRYVRNHRGRSILRRHVNRALKSLGIALSRHDHDYFRVLIRTLWNRRAQRYFDVRSKVPYQSNFCFLSEDWNERNPPVSRADLDRLLDIHILSHPDSGENDIYDRYERNGISSAEYFFESRMDQFYRLIFFFLELRARGITTDDDDVYEGRLTHDVLSAKVHMIIDSDFGYRSYLLQRRHEVLNRINDTENVSRQNLERYGRVHEEDLIWLMMNTPSTSGTNKKTSGTTILSTTTVSSTSTSSSELVKQKKGTGFKNKNKKSFPKRHKATFPESCCKSDKGKSSAKELKKRTRSCVKERFGYRATNSTDLVFVACAMLHASHRYDKVKAIGKIKTTDKHCSRNVDNFETDKLLFPNEEHSFIKTLSFMLEGPDVYKFG